MSTFFLFTKLFLKKMSDANAAPRVRVPEVVAVAPAALTLEKLDNRLTLLDKRLLAGGIIFFIANTGLLFLIIANYILVGTAVYLSQNH